MGLSIRWRLTLWNTSTLAVLLIALGAMVYGIMRHSHYERVDDSLRTAWKDLERKPDQNLAHWINEIKEHQNLLCVVYDSGGQVVARSEELPQASIPAASLASAGSTFFDTTLPAVGRQRVLRDQLRTHGRQLTFLVLADLEELDREMQELLMVLAVSVPMALAVAAGLGYFLARKALAPMQQLHRLTQEITAERLDRRLPVIHASDELGTLTQTINAMIGRLERSFAEIRRFTADASHELRTPLTAIRTEAEVALRRPMSTAEYRQLLGSILEECERLTRLTDQLLTLSRQEAAAPRLLSETVDLGGLVETVAEAMRPLALAKGLQWQVSGNGTLLVRGDDVRLRQVFYNLLDNAIKYTPEGGTVEIWTEARDKNAVVTVRDTGIGIAPEHLPRVFDRFYRADKARSRDQGGTGLGLSIARTIVAGHGGQIELASVAEQGTTCTVTLPRS
ncbi:MAG TPA: heavy metal sensor histidine kinase [Gemmataceae bacterium]|nr:heavy metal sensor histidine kinase [Gemmataceae bacterium]